MTVVFFQLYVVFGQQWHADTVSVTDWVCVVTVMSKQCSVVLGF